VRKKIGKVTAAKEKRSDSRCKRGMYTAPMASTIGKATAVFKIVGWVRPEKRLRGKGTGGSLWGLNKRGRELNGTKPVAKKS